MTPPELLKVYLENQVSEEETRQRAFRQLDGLCHYCGAKLEWTQEDKIRLSEKHRLRENFHVSNTADMCPACCENFMEFLS